MNFASRRIASCFVDHLIYSSIAGVIALPGMFADMMLHLFEHGFIFGSIYLNTIALTIYLSKDVLFSRSFGKQLFGLQLSKHRIPEYPSAFQAYTRNLTFIAWPVEVLILAYDPQRRLGDYIAKTKVVEYQPNNATSRVSYFQRVAVFCLSLTLSYGFMLCLSKVFDWINSII